MRLREILEDLAKENGSVLLNDGENDWKAEALLNKLSEPFLKREAYMQKGMYIAEVNHGGYLGTVLFKITQP